MNGYPRHTRVTVDGTGPGSVISGVLKADGSGVYMVMIDGAVKPARYPAESVHPITETPAPADETPAPAPAAPARVWLPWSDRTVTLAFMLAFVVLMSCALGFGGLLAALLLALPIGAAVRMFVAIARNLSRYVLR